MSPKNLTVAWEQKSADLAEGLDGGGGGGGGGGGVWYSLFIKI